MESTPEVPNASAVVVEGQLYNFKMLCLEDSSGGDSPAELVQRMQQMQEQGGASMGGLLASIREGNALKGLKQTLFLILSHQKIF